MLQCRASGADGGPDPNWLAKVKRRVYQPDRLDAMGAIAAMLVAGYDFMLGLKAAHVPRGSIDGAPAAIVFLFDTVALTAALGDLRLFRQGSLSASARVTRHLRPMCFAAFIATGSFFLGQARVIPEPMRIYPLLMIPAMLPLVAMFYWLLRVRARRPRREPRQLELAERTIRLGSMDTVSHDPGSPQNTQRLLWLGLHAGRIAHDANNLLTTILCNAGLALRELPPEHAARASIQDIERAGRYAADLMAQLLAFATHRPLEVQSVNLSHVVADILRLFKVSIGKNVTLSCDLDEHLPYVRGDITQLRQVVMNLMTNAADAVGDAAGIITVATRAGGDVPRN